MNIRRKIIELLGGVEKQDYHLTMKNYHRSFMQGELYAVRRIQSFMRECYGEDAKVWADQVWKFICKYIEERKSYEP